MGTETDVLPVPSLPVGLLKRLETLAQGPLPAEKLPTTGGAYVLVLAIAGPETLPIARLAHPKLPAGIYLYCGSAYGPGGLKARVGRHMRGGARRHWHIDHLLPRGRLLGVFVAIGGNECQLVSALLAGGESRTVVPGFGASDCVQCPAHLLRWDMET